jgi:hypothetical protein
MGKSKFSESLSEIKDLIKDYINSRIVLIKLNLIQKLSKAGTFLIILLSFITLSFAILIFLMTSFSIWYGEKTGSVSQGFLISAGIFFLILLLIFLLRNVVIGRNLLKIFSRILFSDDENKKL